MIVQPFMSRDFDDYDYVASASGQVAMVASNGELYFLNGKQVTTSKGTVLKTFSRPGSSNVSAGALGHYAHRGCAWRDWFYLGLDGWTQQSNDYYRLYAYNPVTNVSATVWSLNVADTTNYWPEEFSNWDATDVSVDPVSGLGLFIQSWCLANYSTNRAGRLNMGTFTAGTETTAPSGAAVFYDYDVDDDNSSYSRPIYVSCSAHNSTGAVCWHLWTDTDTAYHRRIADLTSPALTTAYTMSARLGAHLAGPHLFVDYDTPTYIRQADSASLSWEMSFATNVTHVELLAEDSLYWYVAVIDYPGAYSGRQVALLKTGTTIVEGSIWSQMYSCDAPYHPYSGYHLQGRQSTYPRWEIPPVLLPARGMSCSYTGAPGSSIGHIRFQTQEVN